MTSWGPDRLDIFAVGFSSSIYHRTWDGNTWQPWDNLGGSFAAFDPTTISWGPNRLDVFAVGTDSQLYSKTWDGTQWFPSQMEWTQHGGILMGRPTVVSMHPGRLDVFCIGTDRAIYQKFYTLEDGWNDGFVRFEGRFLYAPAVCSRQEGWLNLFATGIDSSLHHKWFDGTTWGPEGVDGGWENMGGAMVGQPKVVSWGEGRIDIVVVGLDSALYHKYFDPNSGQWGPNGVDGWERMGGTCQGDAEIVSWGRGRLDLFVIGVGSNVHHKYFDNGEWGPQGLDGDWEWLGGTSNRSISAVCWGPARLDLFIIGKNYDARHKSWQPVNGWTGDNDWESLGGSFVSSIAKK